MDLSKTIFILGAGSSHPYGLPTGDLLKKNLLSYQYNTSNIAWVQFKEYVKKCFDPKFEQNISTFCESLRLSGSASVDTFLNGYGKEHLFHFIGTTLISFEISNYNLKQRPDGEWIEYFIKRFISYNRNNFIQAPPKVLSFNYDKIFEHKLNMNFEKETNNRSTSPISVEHIYGSVSLHNSSKTFDQNDPKIDSWFDSIISDAANNINLIRQNEIVSKWNTIKNFEMIVLLGYGFDPYNNKILFENLENLELLIKEKRIISTGIKMNSGFVERLNKISKDHKPIQIELDCLNLMERLYPPPIFPNEI